MLGRKFNLFSETVFSHFTSHFSRKRIAFTLAEVLITLGIIGVVAALTLPNLITNYQKKVTATKLHQAYNFLQQIFVNAQAEYGDMETWDCFRPHTCSTETFANTYIVPYIKDEKLKTYPNLLVAGYKEYPKQLNGSSTLASVKQILQTKQNYIYMIYFYDTQDNTRRIFNIAIDINGKNKPNILGKDIFITTTGHNLDSNNHYKLQMYNYNSYKKETILKQTCNKTLNSESCGALIEMDNWEISKNYPW